MNTAHGTPQVTDEQIIVIIHLVLQVYCSPSLKEQIHNLVMPLLARNMERTVSILCAHGGVCAYMCVVVVCDVCCMCVCDVCVHAGVWLCVHMDLCALVPVHSEWWIQVYKYTYVYQ